MKESLEALIREVAALKLRLEALEQATNLFASDEDLASQKGNPQVKFIPRDWRGPDFKGRTYSQCSAEFLDVLAETLTWMADNPKPDGEKYVKFNRMDARRARAWGRRIRSGWRPPATAAVGEFPGDPLPTETTFETPAFDAPSFDDPKDEIPW